MDSPVAWKPPTLPSPCLSWSSTTPLILRFRRSTPFAVPYIDSYGRHQVAHTECGWCSMRASKRCKSEGAVDPPPARSLLSGSTILLPRPLSRPSSHLLSTDRTLARDPSHALWRPSVYQATVECSEYISTQHTNSSAPVEDVYPMKIQGNGRSLERRCGSPRSVWNILVRLSSFPRSFTEIHPDQFFRPRSGQTR